MFDKARDGNVPEGNAGVNREVTCGASKVIPVIYWELCVTEAKDVTRSGGQMLPNV